MLCYVMPRGSPSPPPATARPLRPKTLPAAGKDASRLFLSQRVASGASRMVTDRMFSRA